eukprot:12816990-Alexandrium_andersonii.AAC.1
MRCHACSVCGAIREDQKRSSPPWFWGGSAKAKGKSKGQGKKEQLPGRCRPAVPLPPLAAMLGQI